MRSFLAIVALLMALASECFAQDAIRPNGNITFPRECPTADAVEKIALATSGTEYFSLINQLKCHDFLNNTATLFHVDYCNGVVAKVTILVNIDKDQYHTMREAYFSIGHISRFILDPRRRTQCEEEAARWERDVWRPAMEATKKTGIR